MMEKLNFTTSVLGAEAASRLREHQVIQTIRSATSSIVRAIDDGRVEPNDLMQVALDNRFIGYARYLTMDKMTMLQLDDEDVQRGGFNNLGELASALRRAGCRFQPLDKYTLYRCRFTWQQSH